mgnify:CR=1 FL=1
MRLAALSLGLSLLALPVAAQDIECHSSDVFRIAVKPHAEEPGVQIAVNTAKTSDATSCAFDTATADRVIGEAGDPLWFHTLAGNILVLTRSTGPQGDVVVHDLAKGTVLLNAPSDAFDVSHGKLVFWERSGEANAGNCPDYAEHQANAMGSVIAVEKTLLFADGTVTASGASRCDATQ